MADLETQFETEFAKLTDDEQAAIIESFPVMTFKKGHVLLKEGMIAKDAYSVKKGCIREYEIRDGEEKTTAFYTENQYATDLVSQSRNVPSVKFFECLEETTATIHNNDAESSLYRRFPQFEKFCRVGAERMIVKLQDELNRYITQTPTERYLQLVQDRPDLLNRAPQYQIASYLGVKPESLSRIRKRIATES